MTPLSKGIESATAYNRCTYKPIFVHISYAWFFICIFIDLHNHCTFMYKSKHIFIIIFSFFNYFHMIFFLFKFYNIFILSPVRLANNTLRCTELVSIIFYNFMLRNLWLCVIMFFLLIVIWFILHFSHFLFSFIRYLYNQYKK